KLGSVGGRGRFWPRRWGLFPFSTCFTPQSGNLLSFRSKADTHTRCNETRLAATKCKELQRNNPSPPRSCTDHGLAALPGRSRRVVAFHFRHRARRGLCTFFCTFFDLHFFDGTISWLFTSSIMKRNSTA